MNLKELNIEETEWIYKSYMVQDFPADELKKFSMIRGEMEKGNYKSLGLFEEDELRAYVLAVLLEINGRSYLFVDYLAVVEQYRDHGYGTVVLESLRKAYPAYTVILEVEDPDYSESEEDRQRMKRRIAFYYHGGFADSLARAYVYKVHYRYLYCGDEVTKEEMEQAASSFYRSLVSEEAYKKNIEFF